MANSELLKAIYSDDVEAVLKIVEEGIHVNVEYEELGFQWKELAYGIESDFYEFIGTDKKYGDTIPLTPLQCASFYGREDIVKIFLSEGGESQQKNSITNETARDIAGHSENHHIVKLFKHFDQDNLVKKNRKLHEKKEKKEKKKEKSKENKEKKQKEKEEKKKRMENKRNKKKNKEQEEDEMEIED